MTTRQTFARWPWRIAVCVAALFVGQMIAVALVAALGLELPQSPVAVDSGTQSLLFLLAAITIAVALAVMALGLGGRWWERWAILAAFFYVVYGVGNVIEASIFTTIGGELPLAVMHLPPLVFGALVVALLFAAPSNETFGRSAAVFMSRWNPGALTVRLGLAVLAFPLFYFLFGMMVAPIVTPHYERLDFLVLPPLPTILKIVFTRSVLLLLVSLSVIVTWRQSRTRLILALGLGHFVAVGLAGLIQATFFPPVVRWAHGIEILADSICYAAVLAWLLFTRRSLADQEQPVLQERLA
jgi:hypothetical protein